jgi:LuxR family transcriptional regulator, maltose regulon positive regulatory protein
VRARAARGELDAAGRAVAALREAAALAGTGPLQAAADLADGVVAAAAGGAERARQRLEDAVDGFERAGGAYEAALARTELAAALTALDRPDDAAREQAAATVRLAELGAAARPPVPADLSPREREVLELLADGLTNRQIAERLVLSEHTVHRHVANILRKLRVPTRAAAAARVARPRT